MTVKKAIKYLELLIQNRQKILNDLKEDVSKMQSEYGKDTGNLLIRVIGNDLVHMQAILSEILSKGVKSDSKRKKKSL